MTESGQKTKSHTISILKTEDTQKDDDHEQKTISTTKLPDPKVKTQVKTEKTSKESTKTEPKVANSPTDLEKVKKSSKAEAKPIVKKLSKVGLKKRVSFAENVRIEKDSLSSKSDDKSNSSSRNKKDNENGSKSNENNSNKRGSDQSGESDKGSNATAIEEVIKQVVLLGPMNCPLCWEQSIAYRIPQNVHICLIIMMVQFFPCGFTVCCFWDNFKVKYCTKCTYVEVKDFKQFFIVFGVLQLVWVVLCISVIYALSRV